MDIKTILKESVGGIVELSEYDAGSGECEVLSADNSSCTVQFITFCSCYDCCVYSEEIYTKPTSISYELIAGVKKLPMMSKEEIQRKREEFIKMDAPIFERYKKTK